MMKMSLKLAIGFLMLGLMCGPSSLEGVFSKDYMQAALKATIKAYFDKNECSQEMEDCKHNKRFDSDSKCNRTKYVGRCFFDECSAMSNTKDAEKAAFFMVELAKTESCNVTQSWFLSNSNSGIQILRAPMWESLATIMIVAIIMKMFV